MTKDEADRLLRGFAEWARQEPSWRALAVVGSWARGAAREDSDLDLLALTTELDAWTTDDARVRGLLFELGFVEGALTLEVHGVARSWRAQLGANVELEITLADVIWADTRVIDPGTRRVVGDGIESLVDKDGLLRAIQAAVRSA